MRKRKSKIKITIGFLVLFAVSSLFIFRLDFEQNSNILTEESEKDSENFLKSSGDVSGAYFHREDPTMVWGSGTINTTDGITLEQALKDDDEKFLIWEVPTSGYHTLSIANYSDIPLHGEIKKIVINYEIIYLIPNSTIFTFNFFIEDWYPVFSIVNASYNQILNGSFIIDENNMGNILSSIRLGNRIIGFFSEIAGPRDFGEIHFNYIDIYYWYADPPDPPLNPQVHQRIRHNFLTWDEPYNGGANITHYDVYRGTLEGGNKIFIGNSTITFYNDTTALVNITFYYVVSAINFIGESNYSVEISGTPRDEPFLEWKFPEEHAEVIFPVGLTIFNFSYDYGDIDNATLEINGIDFGDIWEKTSILLDPYTIDMDGQAVAKIHGYWQGEEIIIASRNFTFAKLTLDVLQLLEEDTEYIGKRLYLILHDPNGDNSFSSYEESAIVSMGVGVHVVAGVSSGLKFGEIVEDPFFGVETGHTDKLEYKATSEVGFDFRYEITDTTELSSSQDDSNKNYIGPGYGDRYWGESWTFKWALKARHKIYVNGTDRYEEPKLHYGIIRSGEVFLNDDDAPSNWRSQNPIHNGWQNVLWIDNLTVDGGSPAINTYEISSASTLSNSFEIDLSYESVTKVPGLEHTLTVEMSTKWFAEMKITNTYKVGYTIHDDESSDTIVQQYGIDLTFGTFIFKTNEFLCETSFPLERNTFDYLPPIIQFPDINLDSSQDGLAPCEDDSPIVTVDLFDEGGIQSALIFFSINDGVIWYSVILSEQIANPGTWEGTIPAWDHGTTILWYIKVWDLEGSYSNRTDPNGNPYRYTVINRAPLVSITTPSGGEIYQDIVNVEWTGSDPDDDTLTYSLAYNLDNTGWHLIESGIISTSHNWNVSGLASDNVLLKIIVSDGDMESEDVMDFVFAILSPPHAPVIIPPPDIQYLLDSSGNSITWLIYDEDLSRYKVYKDGMFLFSMDVEGAPSTTDEEFEIMANVDGLDLGTYIYKIEIFDGSGFMVSDEVIITVYNNPTISSLILDSTISWNITDTHVGACEYIMFRDGIDIKTGTWESGILVELNYAELAPGNYEFLIYATDGLGGFAADIVFITIEKPSITPTVPYLIIGIIVGAAITGVVFSIMFLRYKLKQRNLEPKII